MTQEGDEREFLFEDGVVRVSGTRSGLRDRRMDDLIVENDRFLKENELLRKELEKHIAGTQQIRSVEYAMILLQRTNNHLLKGKMAISMQALEF